MGRGMAAGSGSLVAQLTGLAPATEVHTLCARAARALHVGPPFPTDHCSARRVASASRGGRRRSRILRRPAATAAAAGPLFPTPDRAQVHLGRRRAPPRGNEPFPARGAAALASVRHRHAAKLPLERRQRGAHARELLGPLCLLQVHVQQRHRALVRRARDCHLVVALPGVPAAPQRHCSVGCPRSRRPRGWGMLLGLNVLAACKLRLRELR